MNIQIPSSNDLEPIQELLGEYSLPYEDITQNHLHDFLIARDGDKLAAVAGLEIHNSAALLRSVAVDKNYRDHGLGSMLIHRLENHARARGVSKLYLLTDTAERFFTQLGYYRTPRQNVPGPIAETREFSEICPESSVCMARDLN